MNGNGSYSSKLRECISNCTWNRVNWKWGQIINSQYSPPMTYMLPTPRLYLLNFPYHSPSITTKWGPSVQILEPMEATFHSSTTSSLYCSLFISLLYSLSTEGEPSHFSVISIFDVTLYLITVLKQKHQISTDWNIWNCEPKSTFKFMFISFRHFVKIVES